MNTFSKQLFISLVSTSLLLASSISNAKQLEIGIAAVANDASLVGKGEFVINSTIDEGDSLKTGEKGNTTVLFNDESMLTLGPNAHASIEVYQEAKDGKPGRSIIRVHKGQFRYFPGGILENGGSQFVAVGNKLLGKSGIPTRKTSANNQRNDSGQNNPNNSNKKRSAATTSDAAEPRDDKGRRQPGVTLASTTEGEQSTGNDGGTSGGIQGPPVSNSRRPQYSGNNVAANPDAPTPNEDTPENSGGGYAGEVAEGGELLASAPEDTAPPSDGTPAGRPAAADAPASSRVASSDSTDDGDSGDTDSGSSSTETSESSSTTVATDSTDTGAGSAVPAAEAFVDVAFGSGGAAPTGGAGGGNQTCAEPPCGSGNGFGGPSGFGGSDGGDDSGAGGLLGGLTGGGRDPDGVIGGLGGGLRGTGGIGGFIDNGISGNVVAGVGSFNGTVDVFASAGKNIGLLGSLSAGKDVGLNLGGETNLTAIGIGKTTSLGSGIPSGSVSNIGLNARPGTGLAVIPSGELSPGGIASFSSDAFPTDNATSFTQDILPAGGGVTSITRGALIGGGVTLQGGGVTLQGGGVTLQGGRLLQGGGFPQGRLLRPN